VASQTPKFRDNKTKKSNNSDALKRFHLARVAVGAILGRHSLYPLVKRGAILEASIGDNSEGAI